MVRNVFFDQNDVWTETWKVRERESLMDIWGRSILASGKRKYKVLAAWIDLTSETKLNIQQVIIALPPTITGKSLPTLSNCLPPSCATIRLSHEQTMAPGNRILYQAHVSWYTISVKEGAKEKELTSFFPLFLLPSLRLSKSLMATTRYFMH